MKKISLVLILVLLASSCIAADYSRIPATSNCEYVLNAYCKIVEELLKRVEELEKEKKNYVHFGDK